MKNVKEKHMLEKKFKDKFGIYKEKDILWDWKKE